MDDTISRAAAIDIVKKNTFRLTFAEEQNCEGRVAWSANVVYSDVIEGALLDLPSAQPERKKGKWINRSLNILYPEWERYTCSACGKHSYNYDFAPTAVVITEARTMTKDEAKEKIINDFCKCRVWCELYPDLCQTESCEIWWALKALSDRPKDKWIPIKWHTITEEEREREGYPKDWVYYLDCEMPEDGQEILVTTKHGYVEKDVCYLDDGYSLDSGWDWREDIVAWRPLPPVYQEEDNK